LNGILAYVEKDLTNRMGEFDKLVESINFKKMEKEDLTKLYAKKKWLQKSSSFLNIIIMKDMDDDDDDGSDKSDKSSETEESEESEEGGSSMPMMDLKRSNSNWAYDKKTKIMTFNSTSWYSMITKKPNDKYTIELCSYVTYYMVGFIEDNKYNQSSLSYNNGYCWYANTNTLYGLSTGKQSWSVNGSTSQGTKIGCVWNKKKGTITFYKDNSKAGDGWTGLDKKMKLFPVLDSCSSGVKFKFVKGKYPK